MLDEADEMLSRGFKEQIYDVFKFMPESVQCTIFSATMPLEVLEVRVQILGGVHLDVTKCRVWCRAAVM